VIRLLRHGGRVDTDRSSVPFPLRAVPSAPYPDPMGRADSRRRKPRRRLPPPGSHLYAPNDTPMTPASEVRAFGRIADAFAYGTRRQRRAVLGLVAGPVVVPVVLALLGALVYLLVQQF
jgi:hypothetical protein